MSFPVIVVRPFRDPAGGRISGFVFHRVQPPARDRGAGGGFVCFRAQHQGGDAGFLGGKLQPPAGSEGHVRYFPDNGGDPAAAQAFFHRPERIGIAAGTDQNHARRIYAELQQGRAVQGAGIQRPGAFAPEDRVVFGIARQTACEQGAECRGDTGIVRENFVQCAPQQSAAGQVIVYRIHAERQDLLPGPGQRPAKSFKLPDLCLQLFQRCRGADRVTGWMSDAGTVLKTGRRIGRNPTVSPFLRGKGAVPGASEEPRHRLFQCCVRTNVLVLF